MLEADNIAEGITQSKILRIREDFGIEGLKDPGEMGMAIVTEGKDADHEDNVLEVFKKQGFIIVRGGKFNRNNLHEIGVGCGDSMVVENNRNERLAELVGLQMPNRFTPEEVIQSDAPVVAKRKSADRGESKFLLETEDQKVKFIAWAILGNKLEEVLGKSAESRLKLDQLLDQVRRNNFPEINRKQTIIHGYTFEEFIETPGSHYNSFRVLVDCFGNVQYGAVLRSGHKKDSDYLPDNTTKTFPMDEPELWCYNFENLLRNPTSPFYLHAKKIVSNIARGGSRIFLNGEPVNDQTDQEVLNFLGIDPQHPMIPLEMAKASSKIGVLSRGDYPFVGVDFLKRLNNGPVMLEINLGPNIPPQFLGLLEGTSPDDCELEMMRRVAESVK